jgi:DNA (cytosine-5)-methyltransferase 1
MSKQLDMFATAPAKRVRKASRPPMLRVNFGDEIVVDNFAGGGGASSGIAEAIGRDPDLAINHDPEAIAMHAANHPDTEHFIENVWQIDPVKVCKGKPVAIAWFSPDCKHHSKAKGGKPREQKIRGLAWVAVRWAAAVKPRVIALENVEEFKDWGPLYRDHSNGCDGEREVCRKGCHFGKPIPEKKGQTFRAFIRKLTRHGYTVEHKLLRGCDYGAPTTRRRLVLVARCDGGAIIWPEATHGPKTATPHRTVAECIDWTLPCPSIFDRKKALSDKTMARIARGVQKFVIDAAKPFIIPVNHGGKGRKDHRVHDIEAPMPTITSGSRGSHALVTPLVVPYYGEGRQGQVRGHRVDEPLPTQTTSNRFALAIPYLVHRSNGERPGQAPRIYDPHKPLGTICAQGEKHALCVAFLARHYSDRKTGGWAGAAAVDAPIPTITTKDHHSLVAALLVRYNGTGQAEPVTRPLGTLTTRDRYGLVTVTIGGEEYEIVDIGMRMLTPRELFLAQGFAPDYQIAPVGPKGRTLSRTAQVRMVGNSVCPPLAAAIVRAQMSSPPQTMQRAA